MARDDPTTIVGVRGLAVDDFGAALFAAGFALTNLLLRGAVAFLVGALAFLLGALVFARLVLAFFFTVIPSARELTRSAAQGASAAWTVEVSGLRFLEREVECASTSALAFQRLRAAYDAERVALLVRPEAAADGAALGDGCGAHGRARR